MAVELKREHHINFWYLIVAFFGIMFIQDLIVGSATVKTIPYSEFQSLLQQQKVTDLVVGSATITGKFKNPEPPNVTRFSTVRVDPAIAKDLAQPGIVFSGEPGAGWFATVLGWFMPALGFFVLWMLLIRPMLSGQGAGGLMAIGKSRAKVYVETDVKVTFADVAGVDEAKDELKEVVAFLKDPVHYSQLGAHMPKGILLVGPPGTGKTLLARAVAGEAGVAFFSISGCEFVEMFVGVGAARVRDLFEQARKQAPAIIFIDELDALGRARGAGMPGMGGHDEKEQTLNQLLSELDGFDTKSGIVLLAATNRPEILDPALLRAGRFDRQVLVDRPDKKGRIDILRIHGAKVKLAPDTAVESVAALTPGFTGADLANLVNEAALLATRRGADSVTIADFTQAIERITAGLEKRNRLLNPHEREVVAHHEMGHALVALSMPGTDPVQKVSIIPRGIAALGYTMQRPIEDRFLMGRGELFNRMTLLLAGRAAEALIFPDVSTGAADDLTKATEIARGMVTRFGMDPKLGMVAYETERNQFLQTPGSDDWQPRHYGDATADAIDLAVRGLIDGAFKRAGEILAANKALLVEAATALLAQETLNEEELRPYAARLLQPA